MNVFFADPFYWIALSSPRDSAHSRALEFSRSLRGARIVTTDEVLTEFLAFFSSMGSGVRVRAGRTVDSILGAKEVWVVPQSRQSFLDGLDLYKARPDKRFSLVDCVSMQAMRREGIQKVLTNDEHFVRKALKPCSASKLD